MSLILLSAGKAGSTAPFSDDVFATTLYTGNSAARSIVNGLDLAGQGGLVWGKNRNSGTAPHYLADSVRGALKLLSPNVVDNEQTLAGSVTGFGSAGFSLGNHSTFNGNTNSMVAWAFRKASRFFDVATAVSDATGLVTFSHVLGSSPGMCVYKRTDGFEDWVVRHRTFGPNDYIMLNRTDSKYTNGAGLFTESASSVSYRGVPNSSYVAYLWAHDAEPDGVVQCGTVTLPGAGTATVTLGWTPQFVLLKFTNAAFGWFMYDTTRGIGVSTGTGAPRLQPNTTSGESVDTSSIAVSSTGFVLDSSFWGGGSALMYLAIRAPNKPADVTTYAKFEAWVDAQAGTSLDGSSIIGSATRTLRVTNNNQFPSNNMIGSPHNYSMYGSGSITARVLQHAYPSLTTYTGGVNQKLLVKMLNAGGKADYDSVTRNGYTSPQFGDGSVSYDNVVMDYMYYWDTVLGKAMKRRPKLGDTGEGIPVDFDGVM